MSISVSIGTIRPDRVPDGVRRAVKEFDPTLDILPNRQWDGESFSHRYVIAQKVNRAIETNDDDIIAIVKDWFPVLIIPNAMEIEQRWFHQLHQNKIETAHNMLEKIYEQQFKREDDFVGKMREWARDEGYWYFKKQFNEFYCPSVKPKDPTRAQKELEDKIGRRPR